MRFILILTSMLYTVGTKTTIKSITSLVAGIDFITVTWTQPTHLPKLMDLTSSVDIPPKYNFLNITGLFPGSLCVINVVALYNPARIDPGMEAVFLSLSSGKYI